ncbi:MAG: tRNA (guanosine(37)-N1)-methyltransferase TrmD [bacterium]|nr:tRNA (guanosine(37)-N1)-methyltransferase TrmD [bacterium]
MRFDIITIFPEAFTSYLSASILKRAREKRLIDIRVHNLRDFALDKHKSIDAPPYGGGPGMVFKLGPIIKVFTSLKLKRGNKRVKVILFEAGGKEFNAKMAICLAEKYEHIILIAGHYEGVDGRLKQVLRGFGFKTEEVSIGPYVLTGGELPAMIVIDAVSRHIPGVLGKSESLEEKRFGVGIPAYTRPEIFVEHGKKYAVPKILLSGNHMKIEEWRMRHKKL